MMKNQSQRITEAVSVSDFERLGKGLVLSKSRFSILMQAKNRGGSVIFIKPTAGKLEGQVIVLLPNGRWETMSLKDAQDKFKSAIN